jgi:glycosyltransferase involved in cell wall biosynthesis
MTTRLPQSPMPMTRPKHTICFVGPTCGSLLSGRWQERVVGGAEVQQVLLARELARRGHCVWFIVQHPELPAHARLDGIDVVCTRPARLAPGANALIKTRRLWSVLRKLRPDAIYQRMADWTTGICALAARRSGGVFVHAIASDRDVNSPAGMDGNAWQRWMHRYGMARADVVLAQHAGQVADVQRYFGRTAQIFPSVYHAAPPEIETARAGVYWVGSIRACKRPHLLLDAARRLPHVPFVMIGGPGQGPDAETFHAQFVEEATRLPNVRYLGFLRPDEIDARLADAAVLVNTSEFEGLPVTFLQAWRQGVPTIGLAADGRAELLETCGWPIRTPDELVRLLDRLFREPGRLRARGAAARAYFQLHHAVDTVVPRLEELLDQAIAQRRPADRGWFAGRVPADTPCA